jgi:hypothetical protein
VYAVGHGDPRILIATALNVALGYVIIQIVAVRRRRQSVATAV